jgi:hypothetical protein
MITKLTSSSEFQRLLIEALINKSSGSVNKVSPNSVLSGLSYGVGKIAQKVLKETALIESVNFPDSASGLMLDEIADKLGISPRYTSTSSSTYVRIVADSGTEYVVGTNNFRTNSGLVFTLENNVTVGASGYTYAKVACTSTGTRTNAQAGEINQITTVPVGHKYVVNEYSAQGGRDQEDDFLFRRRIKEGPNVLATGTLAMLEQALNKINDRVLRVFFYGLDNNAKAVLAVASQNGEDFTQDEFDQMIEESEKFFSLTELRPFNYPQSYGLKFQNVVYQPIDISFRVDLLNNVDLDEVRVDIQTRISKLYDYRDWTYDRKVEWDDLLEVVKNTRGVKYVPDQFFFPQLDVTIDQGKLPRFRSFQMLDLAGNIIEDNAGNINPIYYPFPVDYNFQSTVLKTI